MTGDYYFANQSTRYSCKLSLENKDIVIVDKQSNQRLLVVSKNSIQVSSRLANTPRVIRFADDSIFETHDHEFVDQYLINTQHSGSFIATQLHVFEHKLHWAFLMLLLVVAFSWGFIQYGVPAIASGIAKIIPNEVTQTLAKGSLDLLDQHYLKPSKLSPARQNEIRESLQTAFDQYKDLNIHLAFRQGYRLGANAFALPDAHIVLTDELINLTQNNDEILAIVAHEIGHIQHQHLLKRVVQDSLLTTAVMLMTGDVSYVSSIIVAVPTVLLEFSYSRQFEREADDFAYHYLMNRNISLKSFSNIMTRLDQSIQQGDESKAYDFLSTHPQTNERITRFKE